MARPHATIQRGTPSKQMPNNSSAPRYKFIGHALNGDGPFRPSVSVDANLRASSAGPCYLVQYPRESDEKYARRCELAWYASPLAHACSRFSGYLATREVTREYPHELFEVMAADVDGKGNAIDVFMQQLCVQAKARGAVLLLVDMPAQMAPTLGTQLATRTAPYWTVVLPESIMDYEVGDDGRLNFGEFSGNFTKENGERVSCVWHFDREGWRASGEGKATLAEGEHGLGECPLIVFTESGDFPCFGPFAAIADLSKRLYNLDSELDEILRAQTFSLLTMQVPDDSTVAQKMEAAKAAGETIGTNNLMVHSGSTPAFIAPPDGPARVYLDRIDKLRDQIGEIGLSVATVNQQESGIAMQMRFQTINAELSRFSVRMEDFERRAWDLSRNWLGMQSAPDIQWPRDFNIADVEKELKLLTEMQAAGFPPVVIAEQQKRVVSLQFGGLEQDREDEINAAIDERGLETT